MPTSILISMIFKKKLLKPEKKELSVIERRIILIIIDNLEKNYSDKLMGQLDYLFLINRVKYKSSMTTEFYPEKYGIIPEDLLFLRKEEFRLAVIKYYIDEQKFSSEINFVSGRFFDISFRSIVPTKVKSNFRFGLDSINIIDNLETNLYSWNFKLL